jgi:GT2 family glycosyltransferase
VDAALACFVADDIFAVCARVLDPQGDEQGTRTGGFWRHGLLFYDPLPHRPASTDCFFAVGGQSFFRADILRALGSIDELMWPMYHEDIELSYRAWKAGYRIVYAPGSVCHHLGSRTSRKVFTPVELRSFVRQNELLMVWKNVDDPRMLVEHVLWSVVRLAAAVLRRDRATLLGSWHAIQRLPAARRGRRQVRAQVRRSDREVLALVAKDHIEASATS